QEVPAVLALDSRDSSNPGQEGPEVQPFTLSGQSQSVSGFESLLGGNNHNSFEENDAVLAAASDAGSSSSSLTPNMRRKASRVVGRMHSNHNFRNRLTHSVSFIEGAIAERAYQDDNQPIAEESERAVMSSENLPEIQAEVEDQEPDWPLEPDSPRQQDRDKGIEIDVEDNLPFAGRLSQDE
ncbi:unnamed protein product, partial [Polarella glacialis]